jgi:hypothetical protein
MQGNVNPRRCRIAHNHHTDRRCGNRTRLPGCQYPARK